MTENHTIGFKEQQQNKHILQCYSILKDKTKQHVHSSVLSVSKLS